MRHTQTTFEPENGTIRYFIPSRGYGFLRAASGEDVFFYITTLLRANRDSIPDGTPVRFVRGIDKDGRIQVHHFTEIDGTVPEIGTYRLNGMRRFELVRPEHQRDSAVNACESAYRAKPAAPAHECPREMPPTIVVSRDPPKQQYIEQKKMPVGEHEWVPIRIRKIRREKTSYAESDTIPSIAVSWQVLTKAGITGQKPGDRFEARCRAADGAAEVLEIRRH